MHQSILIRLPHPATTGSLSSTCITLEQPCRSTHLSEATCHFPVRCRSSSACFRMRRRARPTFSALDGAMDSFARTAGHPASRNKRKNGRYAGRVRLALVPDRSAQSLGGFIESAAMTASVSMATTTYPSWNGAIRRSPKSSCPSFTSCSPILRPGTRHPSWCQPATLTGIPQQVHLSLQPPFLSLQRFPILARHRQ